MAEKSDKTKHEITQILGEFIRVIKITAMYPEDNPLPRKLRDSFTDRFVDLVQEAAPLLLEIRPNEIIYQQEVVYADKSPEDALAALLYKAGLNGITLRQDFNLEDCQKFFSLLKSYINKEPGAGDLIALLWEADLPGLTYHTVDDALLDEYDAEFLSRSGDPVRESFIKGADDSSKLEYAAIFDADDAAALPSQSDLFEDTLAESKMGIAPGTPRKQKAPVIDTARIVSEIFNLEKSDMARVDEIIQEDALFDPYQTAAELLEEILWQPRDFTDFNEIVTIIEKLQTEFIKAGKLRAAGRLINLMVEYGAQAGTDRPQWARRLQEAVAVAGGREKLSVLADTLNREKAISPLDLSEYLALFGWESLMVITDLLDDLESQVHREAVCDFLAVHGRDHVDFITRAIYDKRWYVVRNAASILARIGSPKALAALEKLLTHPEPRIRLEIVRRLARKGDLESRRFLTNLVWDGDDLICRTALEAVIEFCLSEGSELLTGIINDDRFAGLKEAYQESIIMAYSRTGGDQAVEYLARLAAAGRFWTTQEQEFLQRVSFRALAVNKTEAAEKELAGLARSWKRKVRNMAQAALRHRENHRQEAV